MNKWPGIIVHRRYAHGARRLVRLRRRIVQMNESFPALSQVSARGLHCRLNMMGSHVLWNARFTDKGLLECQELRGCVTYEGDSFRPVLVEDRGKVAPSASSCILPSSFNTGVSEVDRPRILTVQDVTLSLASFPISRS